MNAWKAMSTLLIVTLIAASAQAGDGWPQWLGPRRDGLSSEKGAASFLARPRKVWTASVGLGPSSIAVRDGRAFAMGHVKGLKGRGTDNTGTDYQGSDSKKSSLKCIDLETGEVRWTVERTGWGNLIVFDGKLLFLRETGELVIADADPAGYRELSRAEVLPGRTWSIPALADGRLYCRNNSGDVVCLEILGAAASAEDAAPLKSQPEWPRFRGPGGLGIAPFKDIPISFNGKTGEGVLWKAAVPLPGQSSPVILGSRLFLTGADKRRKEVFCYETDSGKLLWRREVKVQPADPAGPAKEDDEANLILAASTPVASGDRVHVIFGNGDVASFDLEGKEVWSRSFGGHDNPYGYSASLEVWKDLLILQLDQGGREDGKSRLLALAQATGKTVWEAKRPVPSSWSTPIVIESGGRDQIVTCADPWVIAYEPAGGAEIWRAKCMGGQVVPSPVFAAGLAVAASADGELAAIRPDGKGDVTATHIAWSSEDDLPPVSSPVASGGLVYTVTSFGLAACYDLKDGKRLWEKDFETSFQASPSIAGDLVLFLSDGGTLFALRAGRKCEMASQAEVGEGCQASPAFAPGRMYIRGSSHLFCMGKRESAR